MKKINIIKSKSIPLHIQNIDTDQIIPSRFLKKINKKGFGENLFRDWRFKKNNSIIKKCILNNEKYKNRKILIVGRNFGCGSSREHAIWALLDYGLKVIISSFFADIFKENALNNGLLIIEVSENFLKKIFNIININSETEITINLKLQTIKINQIIKKFKINSYKKNCLIKGYDDIDFLYKMKKEIIFFEKKNKKIIK